jgi:hypothetical protein
MEPGIGCKLMALDKWHGFMKGSKINFGRIFIQDRRP